MIGIVVCGVCAQTASWRLHLFVCYSSLGIAGLFNSIIERCIRGFACPAKFNLKFLSLSPGP